MTSAAVQGAGSRLPAYSADVPRGSIFQLLAAWVLLAQGALGALFLPIIVFSAERDIAPRRITTFAFAAVLCIAAGGVLYTHWRWAWWLAFAVAVGVPAWILITDGLTGGPEKSIAAGFGAIEVICLILGRAAAGRPEAMALVSARIPFRLKVTMVWLSIFFVLGLFFALSQFDVAWMRENFSYVAAGLKYTIGLAVFAIILAVVLAVFGALGRLSRNPVAYGVSGFYTSFFRGTPLIVQLFIIYLALPEIGRNLGSLALLNVLTLTTFQAGVLGLGLNYGAYMTEIFRAGIQSVGHGQAEAADALGMTYAQRMRRVVLPQATRVIIPPTGNEFIAMMKDTALVGFLGIEVTKAEVFRRAGLVGNQDFRNLESLILAASLYWALTAIFTVFQARLERRLSKGYVRTEVRAGAGGKRPQFLPHGGIAGDPEVLGEEQPGGPVGAGEPPDGMLP